MARIGAAVTRFIFWSEIGLNIVALYLMSKPQDFLATFIPPEGRSEAQLLAKADELFGAGGQAFLSWVSKYHAEKCTCASNASDIMGMHAPVQPQRSSCGMRHAC